jgi:hypothetical protein
MGKPHVHPSKIDAWLIGVLLGSAVFGLMCAEAAAKSEQEHRVAIYLVYIGAVIAVVVLSLPTRYEITERDLLVRSGLMRWKIPLTDIQEIHPTESPVSSPAWSLDRLQVRFLRGGLEQSLCISPMDQAAFLADISAADMNLVVDGDEVRRRKFEG